MILIVCGTTNYKINSNPNNMLCWHKVVYKLSFFYQPAGNSWQNVSNTLKTLTTGT